MSPSVSEQQTLAPGLSKRCPLVTNHTFYLSVFLSVLVKEEEGHGFLKMFFYFQRPEEVKLFSGLQGERFLCYINTSCHLSLYLLYCSFT